MEKNEKNSDQQYTKEATFGTLPVRRSERQYGMLDAFLVLSGYGVATWCYTQGTFQAAYCNFKQLLTTTFAANIFVLALYLLPVLFAAKYGIDMWQWLKSTFGTKGAGVVALVLTAVNFPWFGQCAEIFANTIDNLIRMAGMTPPAFLHKPMGLLCIALGTIIAIAGPLVIKWANRIIVPLLLLVGVAICVVAFTSVPLGDIVAYKPDLSFLGGESGAAYAIACEAGLAFGMSWCASTAVTPRLCRKERDGYWATIGAYGVVAPFFVMAGGVLGIATFIKTGVMGNDITEMLVTLSSPVMALTTLALVIFANIATQGTGSYMWSVVLKSTFPKVKFNIIAIVLGVYAGIMVIWGQLLDYIGAMITIAAFFYGPVMGIMFVDYFFIRKRKVSLRAVYELEGHDCYQYTRGFNVVAFGCAIIGIIGDLLIFDPIAYVPKSPVFNFATCTFFGFILTAVLFFIANQIPAIKKYMIRDREDITV